MMGAISDLFRFPMLTILSTMFAWFSVKYMPSGMILFWLFVSILADLVTGLLKSYSLEKPITSIGFRRSITKLGSYAGTILVVVILVNMISSITNQEFTKAEIVLDSLLGYMIFIEAYSVFENISEAYPNGMLARYLINPLMRLLKRQIKDNPINKEAENNTD